MKIIGIGNPFASDDGIGIELVHRLCGELPASYEFDEAPHPGLELLDDLDERTPIVFLDAVKDASPVGTVHWLEWREHAAWINETSLSSSHSFSVLEVLRLAQSLGRALPPIYFLGVSIKSSSACERLSTELARQLPEIVKQSRRYILQAMKNSLGG